MEWLAAHAAAVDPTPVGGSFAPRSPPDVGRTRERAGVAAAARRRESFEPRRGNVARLLRGAAADRDAGALRPAGRARQARPVGAHGLGLHAGRGAEARRGVPNP